jgi:hypothetical protein
MIVLMVLAVWLLLSFPVGVLVGRVIRGPEEDS